MIQVLVADPLSLSADGLVRPVGEDMEGITPWSREAGRRAGSGALGRLEAMRGLPVGGAVVTPGGGLEVDFLIHVVLFSRDEPPTIAGAVLAVRNALRRASEWEMESLVLPPPGLGAGGIDAETLAPRVIGEIRHHLSATRVPSRIWLPVREGYEETVFLGALA